MREKEGEQNHDAPLLEGQIRTRLAGALQSAERGVSVATEKQHLSEMEVHESVARVETLRGELAALTR